MEGGGGGWNRRVVLVVQEEGGAGGGCSRTGVLRSAKFEKGHNSFYSKLLYKRVHKKEGSLGTQIPGVCVLETQVHIIYL